MSDLKKYIEKRKASDPEFAKNYDNGYQEFKIGVMLKIARESAGLTQEQLAQKLSTKKSAISRIENHAEDIKLSTLEKLKFHVKVLRCHAQQCSHQGFYG
jgi:HTH-type transcriptional regulator/antitoxin HipB